MAKLKPNLAEINEFTPQKMLQNYVTPDVKTVDISTLVPHPNNKKYFRTESPEYFERLREDIQKRGIVVPLIAKKDGQLLAGHNRLAVAKELGLKYVPVQYVMRELSKEQEQEFLIKDNLLRRQFTGEEWVNIYRNLYPNFEEEILSDRLKGRAKKGAQTLSAKSIAEDTGQNVSAVQKQLQKFRRTHEQHQANNSAADSLEYSLEDSSEAVYPSSTKKGGTVPPFHKTSNNSSIKAPFHIQKLKESRKKCMMLLKECTKKIQEIDDVKQIESVQKKIMALAKFLG